MESPFEPFLRRQGFVLLDGGLATALEALGHDLDDPLWSARVLLDAPGAVTSVHRSYLEAGADCIATVTYQLTYEALADRGFGPARAEAVFREAVELAVEARDGFWAREPDRRDRIRPLVAASVGPYGAFLADGSEYRGEYGLSVEELQDFHRRRWRALADSPADLLACETIPSLPETRALLALLEDTPDRWACVSFQCRDPQHLADGSLLAEAVRMCHGAERVAAVGVNCVPPAAVSSLLATLGAGTDKPLMAYPNSGEVYDPATKGWLRTGDGAGDGDLVQTSPAWLEAGAVVLGGCCRTGPETIRDLRRTLLTGRSPVVLPPSSRPE